MLSSVKNVLNIIDYFVYIDKTELLFVYQGKKDHGKGLKPVFRIRSILMRIRIRGSASGITDPVRDSD